MPEIKFCENNFVHGTEELSRKLREELGNADITVDSCLGFCGDCASGPYALVNDEMVQADTVDELYKKIKEML